MGVVMMERVMVMASRYCQSVLSVPCGGGGGGLNSEYVLDFFICKYYYMSIIDSGHSVVQK